MTNEEAIDVLMYLWRHEISERNTEGEIRRALNMGMAAIKREQRWIPVSERLPEKNGEYLITGRQGAVNKRRYHDGHWYGNWSVLAWMPLPEPYKAESEES
jgi:hypothetical protein